MKKRRSKANNRKYNVNSSGLNSELNQTIIASLLIVGILFVFGALVFRFNRPEPSVLGFESQDVWEEAFKQVEGSRVGVVFDSVATSEKQYSELRSACNQYIEKATTKEDTTIGVDVKVDEEQFIDGMENANSEISQINSKDKLDKVETGPIYFSDAILIRYIDELGRLNVTFGIGNDPTKESFDSINVISHTELNDKYQFIVNTESAEVTGDHGKYIDENLFCYKIAKCIKMLLEADNLTEEREAITDSLQYFTQDGKNNILKYRNALEIKSDDTLDLQIVTIGKSDTSKSVKDRLYLQYMLNNELVSIVVKLNSNLRVFDVDLLK